MANTIYLVQAEDTQSYKIGFTNQDPEKRLSQLQTGNGTKLKLLKEFKTKYGTKLESRLHKEFRCKRTEGEWFVLDREDVMYFERTCQKFEAVYDVLRDNPFSASLYK
jgi:hypothetical protein